jgi:hypothetical protein
MSRDLQANAEYKEAHEKISVEDVLKAHHDNLEPQPVLFCSFSSNLFLVDRS